ncbi:MAG TPA: hypothetical protein VKQ71_16865, partial [Acidimicrobiales bacterium]|nr:hypothetical protein [Acidimicrobiales bacterium]
VANVGPHDPANIFPDLTIDRAGNLYYTWSQASSPDSSPNAGGETDVFYTFSTNGGSSWAAPVDLTKESGDSAVFPWLVAGSPGEVDLVYYKADTGLNPNVAGTDSSGAACDPSSQSGCTPNTTKWNTYFVQSQNALNSGANFKSVQISPHPIHIGGVCTGGISCNNSQSANRDLLDFFTVDVDHLGAAYVTWADDNNSFHDTRQFFSRQLSGASIFGTQNISAQNSWPTTSSSATDPAGDVYSASGTAEGSCSGMDLLGDSASDSGSTLQITLTLNNAPTSAEAIACSGSLPAATGGLWGAEFWAASTPVANSGPDGGNDNFYIAYKDNPPDGAPGVEAGAINAISASFTHDEFQKYENGKVGGTCTSATPPSPCTLVISASLAGLGIKPGAALDSTSGFSVYYFGSEQPAPGTRVPLGNSNLADAIAPFDLNGTGTTTK